MATTTRLAALVGGLAIAITSCLPSTTSSVPAADTETAPTAVADISDPIAVTAESGEPFRGVNEQPVAGPGLPLPVLVPYGYVEEEYFVSGTVDGTPYSTALLVRKPQDPARFSGLVAIETIHMWALLRAPAAAVARGDWSVVPRDDGLPQWTYQGQPLYRCLKDVAQGEATCVPDGGQVVEVPSTLIIREGDGG